ncbi:hypothetical protein DWF00_27115 [Bosea caraganae]|uniref:Uncharacterized protein n=1 Tax=Bosea caraganae TaxID=2763117 RepID=A0A370L9K1_9HYPH|nr:hypothetical protein [Bosea caraganae]RDJ21993.1 hypothetical protein DWF00_27115 [Bosea caraganae]RDJ27973.1 hypothetical protein DWE98_05040 [Bosea caraganae]
MPVTNALLIVLGAFVWIEGGRAHWRLIVQADAAVHPELAATCEFRRDLAAGHLGAHLTRWCFILFWPFWLALGWLNAAREHLRGR